MGSWRYAGVEPVRGMQTVPRTVELKTFPEGIRLVQSRIKELESLRKTLQSATDITFEGVWKSDKLKPSKNTYELILEIENLSAEDFGAKIGVGNNQQTVVGYSVKDEEIYIDRRKSGLVSFSTLFPESNKGFLRIEIITSHFTCLLTNVQWKFLLMEKRLFQVRDDLVHWYDVSEAIFPENDTIAPDGIWSGSATLDEKGEPVLFYTFGNLSKVLNQGVARVFPKNPKDPNLTEWTKRKKS